RTSADSAGAPDSGRRTYAGLVISCSYADRAPTGHSQHSAALAHAGRFIRSRRIWGASDISFYFVTTSARYRIAETCDEADTSLAAGIAVARLGKSHRWFCDRTLGAAANRCHDLVHHHLVVCSSLELDSDARHRNPVGF